MGILNYMAAKILGAKTVSELCDEAFFHLLEQNELQDANYSMYKLDRSEYDNRFYTRVYIGKALHYKKEVGFILWVDESVPGEHGVIVDLSKILSHKSFAREYTLKKANGEATFGFHNYLIGQCGGKLLDLN